MADHVLLTQAIDAFRSGDVERARRLLESITAADPDDELSWLWYAHVQDGRARQAEVLRSFASRHPESQEARRRLELYYQPGPTATPVQAAEENQQSSTSSGGSGLGKGVSDLAAWQAAAPISEKLRLARHDLLDLSNRNPLLNYRLLKARGVEISEPDPARIFGALMSNAKQGISFRPVADSPETEQSKQALLDLGEDFDDELPAVVPGPVNGIQGRGRLVLQTTHSSKELDKRLLSTYYTARTYIEEQGVNVLYLAFGMLTWYEAADSKTGHLAPLVLVPVEITRTDVRSEFRARYTEDELGENLSLCERLRREFGIELPPLPDVEDLDLHAYYDQVARAIRRQPSWKVDESAMALGFFSFSTFLMHNDLLEETWAGVQDISAHPLVQSMLANGFRDDQSAIPDDTLMDELVNPAEAPYIVDADSTQLAALLEVSRGRNLVIQGPPGTGKSQTITNMIAQAVAQGKRVLFVAEKLAALEVVKRRLDQHGLGPACLELHSQKANKRAVLAELGNTLRIARPGTSDSSADLDQLIRTRDRLNAYSAAVNTPIRASGVTPYGCYGELLRLAARLGDAETPKLSFTAMAAWSSADYRKHRAAVVEVQALLGRMSVPSAHAFWGTRLPSVPPELPRALSLICSEATAAVDAAIGVIGRLAEHLGVPEARDRAATIRFHDLVQRLVQAPDLIGVNKRDSGWLAKASDVATALRAGQRLEQLQRDLAQVLKPEAWEHTIKPLREVYDKNHAKWWRYLNGDFRRAKQELGELFQQRPPRSMFEQLRTIDAIEESQQLRADIQAAAPLLSELFGETWNGLDSDWKQLLGIAAWLQALHLDVQQGSVPAQILSYVAVGFDREILQTLEAALAAALIAHRDRIAAALREIQIDETVRFGQPDSFLWLPFDDQLQLLQAWGSGVERLQEMVVYNAHSAALRGANLRDLVEVADTWSGAATHLDDLFDRTWYEGLLGIALSERSELALFSGEAHEQCVRDFRELDVLQFNYHRMRLREMHWQQLPNGTAEGGQLGTLRQEIEKKRRHYPVRKLMQVSGNAIQALKPVFMMSPLSIAMFLPPGSINFDLVIFDEASQVPPADALGAILRGRQIVVTGDKWQLPPTNFFEHIDDNDGDEEESPTANTESVLGLLTAQGAPERMLKWHYRSRHESLIAVSNYEFYRNRLVVFPSPDDSRTDTGVIFHHLPNTTYDRGKSRANREEALVVATAVMDHARTRPDRTLGVAAFSVSQMNEVQIQVDRLRRQDPSCEPFFTGHSHEPFFVKNLENVQGDERDVIFISVGYGKSAGGYFSMNFGPLNRDGGERRLNVLITRARYRCEVFSNLRADDIDTDRAKGDGVRAFKRYLRYAESRYLDVPMSTERGADSPFEEDVATVLRDRGYLVDHQVGSAGFFIDLAVKDEQHPGAYLLGIECDGAAYHSARSARDRDRLRQEVLEGLGWTIHRIWSTDWFYRRGREIQRLLAAVESARVRSTIAPNSGPPVPHLVITQQSPPRAALAGALPENLRPDGPRMTPRADELLPPREITSHSQDPHSNHESQQVQPYRVAQLKLRVVGPLHEIPWRTIAGWVAKVVAVESPIHIGELERRIAHAAGAGRTGSRIHDAITGGVVLAQKAGAVRRQGDFVWLPTMNRAPLRDRSALPVTARKLELISPDEVMEAVIKVVTDSMGMQPQDIPGAVCRLLGFGRTSADMEVGVTTVVQEALAKGRLAMRGDFVMAEES